MPLMLIAKHAIIDDKFSKDLHCSNVYISDLLPRITSRYSLHDRQPPVPMERIHRLVWYFYPHRLFWRMCHLQHRVQRLPWTDLLNVPERTVEEIMHLRKQERHVFGPCLCISSVNHSGCAFVAKLANCNLCPRLCNKRANAFSVV